MYHLTIVTYSELYSLYIPFLKAGLQPRLSRPYVGMRLVEEKMAQEIDPYRNEPAPDNYQAPTGKREPESVPTDEIIEDLARDLDHSPEEQAAAGPPKGIMQPMVWTMMLLVVLLGGWTFLIQEPALEPGPLDLNSFRATPEILQVDVAPPDVLAHISFNRWMKLRPQSRVRLVEDASRVASTAGYHSITFKGTDGTSLASWRKSDGVQLLYPEPDSVNVQLP